MTDSVLNLPDDTRMLDVVRRGLARADDVRIAPIAAGGSAS